MTQVATESAVTEEEPVRDKTVIVEVPKGSRLEQLLTVAEWTRDRRAEAEAAEEEGKKAVLAELMELYPAKDIQNYEIPACQLWNGMNFGFSTSDYLPAPLIREHLPAVYEAFKKPKKMWKLTFKKGR